MQKTHYPMLAALGGILLNLVLSYWFVNVWGDYRLLALSTVISGWFMALMLMLIARIKVKALICKDLFISFGKTIVASAALGVGAYGVRLLTDAQGLMRSLGCAGLALLAGVTLYFAVLWLLRSQELMEIFSLLKKKKGGNE